MIGPRTFLEYRNYRYLKISLTLLVVSSAAYFVGDLQGGRGGDTWTGYGIGIIAASIVFWLMWIGVRKRDYASIGAPLRGWVSAHVYLGMTLLLLVPLHSAFEFGLNVHTLAYALICVTVLSGMLGVGIYALVPTEMTRNRNNITLDAMLERIAEIDSECRIAASGLPDYYAQAVVLSLDETTIGGTIRDQLSGWNDDCATSRALRRLTRSDIELSGEAKEEERKLIELIARKELLLKQISRDLRFKGILDLWLIVHVPAAFATCAAVGVHVFVVFWYR